MSSMEKFRRLVVITCFLAALQLFIIDPAYCDWRNTFREVKENSTSLNLTAFSKMASAGGNVIVVDANGKGQFSTVQAAINSVPANNKNPVTIKVNPGTYK